MFARERSTRGHMKSPSIAQRGEGGARGGSGELKPLLVASYGRSVLSKRGGANYFPRVPSTAAPIIITAASAMLQLSARPLTSISKAVEHSGVR